jgi:small subunit ribosomal protein S9
MTEDPRNPQDDETPDAAGDVAEPDASAEPSEQPPAEGEAPPEQPAAEAEEAPAEAEQPAAEAEQPAAEAEEPAAEAGAPAEQPAADAEQPAAATEQPKERGRPSPSAKRRSGRGGESGGDAPDVVPGAHLEPDLVLETPQETPDEFGAYTQTYDASTTPDDGSADTGAAEAPSATEGAEPAPVARTPLDLAADARYQATGKRKTAVARVILKPGDGSYTINGRTLDVFFPRPGLQRQARGPLETAGYESRMDVVAKIHGGGVSAQAGALRHGIARALVEADPNLRTELKRHGFLTRDARVKERKKAGLKKARKRPQFSKR